MVVTDTPSACPSRPSTERGWEDGGVRVLGVDPGLTRCGLGVVDGLPGRKVRMVAVGVAQSPPSADIDQRLLVIAATIDEWLEEHAPDALAVERVFAQHNVSTVMGTAQVAGIAMLAAARRKIPVAMHTPSEVKAAVTGSGRAEKLQVQTMVARLLSLDELPLGRVSFVHLSVRVADCTPGARPRRSRARRDWEEPE